MCERCYSWNTVHGGRMIHNTVPGGCKDFIDRFDGLDQSKENTVPCHEFCGYRIAEKMEELWETGIM